MRRVLALFAVLLLCLAPVSSVVAGPAQSTGLNTQLLGTRLDPQEQLFEDGTGSISGYVYTADGVTPLSGIGIQIDPIGAYGSWIAFTEADGSYMIEGLPPGSYLLRAQGVEINPTVNYFTEFYGGARDSSEATPVTVIAGENTPDITFYLDHVGSISGHVYAEDGATPLSGLTINADDVDGVLNGGRCITLADGSYTISGLEAGNFRLVCYGRDDYLEQHYSLAAYADFATPVTVVSGQDTGNIDFRLVPAGSISGYVYAEDGITPLEDSYVYACAYGDDSCFDWPFDDRRADGRGCTRVSALDGSYTLDQLPAGEYVVWTTGLHNSLSDYPKQFYNGTSEASEATPVSVTGGATTANINLTVGPHGGNLAGHVYAADGTTPLAGIPVVMWASNEMSVRYYASTDADGAYRMDRMEVGSFVVVAVGSSAGYLDEFYGGASDPSSAELVNVSWCATTEGIDFTLDRAGQISGHVYADDGTTPLRDIHVEAYVHDSGESAGASYTDADGSYTIESLRPGDYRIEFRDPAGIYATQYYNGAVALGQAADVLVAEGATVANIDATLGLGARISGTVGGAAGPASGMCINVTYQQGSEWVNMDGWNTVDGEGRFEISGLAAGTYRLFFFYYMNEGPYPRDLEGTEVTVTAGEVRSDLNITLPLGSHIQGYVTDANTGDGIPGIFVDVTRVSDGFKPWGHMPFTDENGWYSTYSLPAGTYRVYFDTCNIGFEYPPMYYGDSSSFADAADVVIAVGETKTGISIALMSGPVREIIALPPGGSATTSDGALTLIAPPAAEPLTITYTPAATPTPPPGGFEGAGMAFELDAVDADGNPITVPSEPLQLVLHYDEEALPAGALESSLQVRRYDEATDEWVPLTTLALDTNANTITVLLDHFSQFALWCELGVAPTVGAIVAPLEPIAVSTSISASAAVTDPDAGDTLTALWSWGDGSASAGVVADGQATGNHIYTTPGVYTVQLTVTDSAGLSAQAIFEYIVAQDPNGWEFVRLVRQPTELSMALAAHTSGDTIIAVADLTGTFFGSADEGQWDYVPHEQLQGNPYIMALSPNYANDHRMYLTFGYGFNSVAISQDQGSTWQNTLPGSFHVKDTAFSPRFAEDGTMYVADAKRNAVSHDWGQTWSDIPRPSYEGDPEPDCWEGNSVAVSPDGQVLMITGITVLPMVEEPVDGPPMQPVRTWVQSSTDGGNSWVEATPLDIAIRNDFPGSFARGFLRFSPNFASDRTVALVSPMYGTYLGRVVSDGTVAWTRVAPPECGNPALLAFSPSYAQDHTIYVGADTVYMATIAPPEGANGSSVFPAWSVLGTAPNTRFAVDLEFSPADSSQLYAFFFEGIWRYTFRNTLVGNDELIRLWGDVSVTFAEVSEEGNTKCRTYTEPPASDPVGYQMLGAYYDITTSASYSQGYWPDAGVAVTIPYDDTGMTPADEAAVRVLHLEAGQWVDCTISRDTMANTVTAHTSHLSWFTTALKLNTPPSEVTVSTDANPHSVNSTTEIQVSFVDPDTDDAHTVAVNWGDGLNSSEATSAGERAVALEHTYTSAGVYSVIATVTDAAGTQATGEYQFVVIYDPDGGFVTGGGWINSPAGAYQPDPTLTGRANFGFVAKYKKGATVPTGNTEFQFKAAGLNFQSVSYDWLVVAGAKAQFKGTGQINGQGNYGFMLTATDGQVNGGGGTGKFRIKIWDKSTGALVYDNQLGASDTADPTTVIGGGSIVIHK